MFNIAAKFRSAGEATDITLWHHKVPAKVVSLWDDCMSCKVDYRPIGGRGPIQRAIVVSLEALPLDKRLDFALFHSTLRSVWMRHGFKYPGRDKFELLPDSILACNGVYYVSLTVLCNTDGDEDDDTPHPSVRVVLRLDEDVSLMDDNGRTIEVVRPV